MRATKLTDFPGKTFVGRFAYTEIFFVRKGREEKKPRAKIVEYKERVYPRKLLLFKSPNSHFHVSRSTRNTRKRQRANRCTGSTTVNSYCLREPTPRVSSLRWARTACSPSRLRFRRSAQARSLFRSRTSRRPIDRTNTRRNGSWNSLRNTMIRVSVGSLPSCPFHRFP